MSFASRRAVALGLAPRFQSALRKLGQHGVEALKPQRVVVGAAEHQRERWQKPAISRRVANVLRKQAVQQGTYGTFDAATGKGWDAKWDVELAIASAAGASGNSGRIRIRVPNKTKRQRTREQRAQKIESNLEGMDERMEEYYAEKHANKPPRTFENYYKKLMTRTKK